MSEQCATGEPVGRLDPDEESRRYVRWAPIEGRRPYNPDIYWELRSGPDIDPTYRCWDYVARRLSDEAWAKLIAWVDMKILESTRIDCMATRPVMHVSATRGTLGGPTDDS